ncbi:hypothetical protein [Nocardia sp. NPDC049526]|uniref:hypothetical protein n=1 Tax=Nocardia sp. NPDC049526 TaxID=3364316 RepID=UPI00378FC561
MLIERLGRAVPGQCRRLMHASPREPTAPASQQNSTAQKTKPGSDAGDRKGIDIPLADADVRPLVDAPDMYRRLEQLTTDVPIYAGVVREKPDAQRIVTAPTQARQYYSYPFEGPCSLR